jgi:hypothetical protein
VCDQIGVYHGIGDYNEEFLERLHQEGICTNKRMQMMKDRTKNTFMLQDGKRQLRIKGEGDAIVSESKTKLTSNK